MIRPRPRRVTTRCYWPHLHGRMRLAWPRNQVGDPLVSVLIDPAQPLPRAAPGWADWPTIRARMLAILREKDPNHPWVQEEST